MVEINVTEKINDVIVFFNNANLNKSILQSLLLNALYPLVLVLTEKDESCVSF